jgi:general secretion pathway protein G
MKPRALLLILCGGLFLSGCEQSVCSLSLRKSNESVLKQDLFSLRSSLNNYTMDRAKAPQSLDDLVRTGYLWAIPKDPVTGKPDWVPILDDALMTVDQAEPGISDVHSSSDNIAIDGTAYSSW